jgi:hypothetical protein
MKKTWFRLGIIGIFLLSLSLRFWGISRFNTLVFDIEAGVSAVVDAEGDLYEDQTTGLISNVQTSGSIPLQSSSGQDFINLFNYIKTNPNSVFKSSGFPQPLIIVSISHSCSNNIGESVIGPILSANPSYYDYISPQLYTCNIGTTNEYLANSQIAWCSAWNNTSDPTVPNFTDLLEQNDTYITYGVNMIIPSINNSTLYSGGSSTNPTQYPNLYWYETDYSNQTNSSSTPTPNSASSAPGNINSSVEGAISFSIDTGAVDFFNTMFNTTTSSPTLGGCISWVNGTVTTIQCPSN